MQLVTVQQSVSCLSGTVWYMPSPKTPKTFSKLFDNLFFLALFRSFSVKQLADLASFLLSTFLAIPLSLFLSSLLLRLLYLLHWPVRLQFSCSGIFYFGLALSLWFPNGAFLVHQFRGWFSWFWFVDSINTFIIFFMETNNQGRTARLCSKLCFTTGMPYHTVPYIVRYYVPSNWTCTF